MRRIEGGDREIVLVGTAHVSRESADLVRRVIAEERPDCVCVELDERRLEVLSGRDRLEEMDLRELIRRGQLGALLFQLLLSAWQRRLGHELGVMPGTEMLEAVRAAEAAGVPVVLCDRDVRTTLRRAAATLSLWRKSLLASGLFAALFERPTLDEGDLRELRREDVLSGLLRELGEEFPGLVRVLIEERDLYLAERIRRAPGRRMVAVLGAGHLEGVGRALREGREADLAALDALPPPSRLGRALAWGIPAVLVLALAALGLREGPQAAGEGALVWVLACGVPSAAGALLALAHPVTVVAAFLAAPVTTLHPLIGAGHVTALVQVLLRPPRVRELREVSADALAFTRWWRNRLLRILLVFVLTSLGSALGAWLGGARILARVL